MRAPRLPLSGGRADGGHTRQRTHLAKLLVYMAYEVLGDEAAWHEPAVIPVRLTQEQMAAMTGSCQQTVSDFLREMQDEGLVRVTRREVVVLHPLRLLERAEL